MDADHLNPSVSFFLPGSRRASEKSNGLDPALSSDTFRHRQPKFFLFHTFQLSCQTGHVQVLPATNETGARLLVASRNDSVYCLYFHVSSSITSGVEEVILAPKVEAVTSLPLQTGWKFGSFASHAFCLFASDNKSSASNHFAMAYLSEKSSSTKPSVRSHIKALVHCDN